MPWTVSHDPTLQIIELVLSGQVTADELHESTSQCIALGRERGTSRFLISTADMKLGASLIDIYTLPSEQYIEEEADRFGRVAVVPSDSPEVREAARFYETVCINRGWMVQVFEDRGEAVAWLDDTR